MVVGWTIRVVCPRCGNVGILMLRVCRRNDWVYITVQHNDGSKKVEHSLGPASQLLDDIRFDMLVKKLVEAYEAYIRQELAKVREEGKKLITVSST